MIFIIILSIVYSVLLLPYFVYIFQIKEYRIDRVRAIMKEIGYFRFFFNISFKLPAITFRNVLVCFISFLIYMYIYREVLIIRNWPFSLLIVIFTPFIPFFSVLYSVKLTDIIAYIKRRRVILQAIQKRGGSKTVFIGITGSFGKTTTKELLFTLLSTSFSVKKTDKNMNTDVGVALSIVQNLKSNTQYFITEMGAYKRGEIKTICDFVNPTYGIITGIGNQHLALFGSLNNIITTKAELLNSLPVNGIAYINKTKGFENFQKQARCHIVSFGTDDSNIEIRKVSEALNPRYEIRYKKNRVTFNSPLPEQFLLNLLPAIALSIDLGVSQEKISHILPDLIQNLLNQFVKVNKQGIKIIDSSYNVNVEGFIGIIELMKSFERKNNIIISKGIIELGEEKENSYNKIISKLNDSKMTFFTTDPLFNKLKNKNNIILLDDENQIFSRINSYQPSETSLSIVGRFSQKFMKKLLNNN